MTLASALSSLALSACADHDITVAGHDFHLSPAYVEGWVPNGSDETVYRVNISNMTDPCTFWRADDPVAIPQDALWFQLGAEGPLFLDGRRHPAFVVAALCISDTLPCSATIPTHRIFHTSGDEVFEADDERLHVSLQFTHEGWPPDFSRELDEPFDVDLETDYTDCE
jgi:hypothetical protein